MRLSVERTADDPARLIDTIAVLKREAKQATLDNPPVGGKLTHYRPKIPPREATKVQLLLHCQPFATQLIDEF